jgi:hypothetical protein
LADFLAAQTKAQDAIAEQLAALNSDVHRLVRQACDLTIDEFLQANSIIADHRMTFMERAALRSECRRLTKFLQLIDVLVVVRGRQLSGLSCEGNKCAQLAAHVQQSLRELLLRTMETLLHIVSASGMDPVIFRQPGENSTSKEQGCNPVLREIVLVDTSSETAEGS